MNRRRFMQWIGAGAFGAAAAAEASASESAPVSENAMGVLVDTTECIGCRKCEFACNKANDLTDAPLEDFEDMTVFNEQRRMTDDTFTVVNRFENPKNEETPIFVKSQCMHCLEPACASACLVGALRKEENGPVSYDAWKCIGCRYCMVACPFEVPAYEYGNALTPQVRKCSLCMEKTAKDGSAPACVEMCPPTALIYGKRSELLVLAREKISANPGRYVDHIYGEHEAGGTSWLYLASEPFEKLAMPALNGEPTQKLAETIQHGVFKFGAAPVMLFGLLAIAMRTLKDPGGHAAHAAHAEHTEEK